MYRMTIIFTIIVRIRIILIKIRSRNYIDRYELYYVSF